MLNYLPWASKSGCLMPSTIWQPFAIYISHEDRASLTPTCRGAAISHARLLALCLADRCEQPDMQR
jgi:hypothetical protein